MKKQKQDEQFIKAFVEVKACVIRIVDAVDTALKVGTEIGSGDFQLSVLRRAVEDDLPRVINDIRRLPEPQRAEYSGVIASYEKALNEFMVGCSHLVKYLETGESFEQFKAGPHIEASLEAMDILYKLVGK